MKLYLCQKIFNMRVIKNYCGLFWSIKFEIFFKIYENMSFQALTLKNIILFVYLGGKSRKLLFFLILRGKIIEKAENLEVLV